jgi:hypothetical protein
LHRRFVVDTPGLGFSVPVDMFDLGVRPEGLFGGEKALQYLQSGDHRGTSIVMVPV